MLNKLKTGLKKKLVRGKTTALGPLKETYGDDLQNLSLSKTQSSKSP